MVLGQLPKNVVILIDNPTAYLIALNLYQIEKQLTWIKIYHIAYYGKSIELVVFRIVPLGLLPILFISDQFRNYERKQ